MIFLFGSLELDITFALTLILLATKLFLALFLGKEVIGKWKRLGDFEFDFLFAFFILMISLFVSRIFYMVFDFFLTQNEITKFPQYIFFWKLGGVIGAVGLIVVLVIIDKTILKFRLYGIPSLIIFGIFVFVLIYPVNTPEDFRFLHLLLIGSLNLTLLIPIIFIYVGVRAPEIRMVSFILSLGIILYLIALIFINEYFLSPFQTIFGSEFRIVIFLVFIIFKLTGLVLITYSATNLYIYNYFTENYV
ncbi:MAG: hypothetical protein GF311_06015 [Candidatus Lokiarchaeota archaeon]|nr:hypothetical protein [Candidatus Lokiarchaeota archaeon]